MSHKNVSKVHKGDGSLLKAPSVKVYPMVSQSENQPHISIWYHSYNIPCLRNIHARTFTTCKYLVSITGIFFNKGKLGQKNLNFLNLKKIIRIIQLHNEVLGGKKFRGEIKLSRCKCARSTLQR